MIFPPLGELLKHVDSKYTLAVMTAKRARQLMEGASRLADVDSHKAVTIAIQEIYENKVHYVSIRDMKKDERQETIT